MPLSTGELNRVADDITASAMEVRVHTGDPGANGTANRVGTASASLAAATWSPASSGSSTYNAAAALGVLDTTNNQTVTWYSIFRSTTFVGREEFSASVTVIAGGTFTINTGTIMVNLTTS